MKPPGLICGGVILDSGGSAYANLLQGLHGDKHSRMRQSLPFQ